MSTSNFASSFAPYTPPPDDPTYTSTSRPVSRPWFPGQSSQQSMSYQSGGIPTFNTSQAGGLGAVEEAEAENGSSMWETRYGLRVDMLAAFAYLLGPISALLLLIVETHNDYVRYHAYQSALLATPLVLLRIFASLLQFPSFLRTLLTLLIVLPLLYMTWRAYIDAARNGLTRFQVPGIGSLADRWVSEE
ncbi:hypothetical protein SCP_0110850 [Sparassis crispa]|uniref:Uncharacterized protein n=1 Tax=Sparassis crispa TaxID=139825 RepID=A0A401G7R2_9APHY|nr:hypothetical protein SCP_0110850 [Sparassis crispa]GBE78202.1 hypothetical protein SCP_0110850 [Sparassis crispa]